MSLGDDLGCCAAADGFGEADTGLVGDGKGIVARDTLTIFTTSSTTHIQSFLIDLDAVSVVRLW